MIGGRGITFPSGIVCVPKMKIFFNSTDLVKTQKLRDVSNHVMSPLSIQNLAKATLKFGQLETPQTMLLCLLS